MVELEQKGKISDELKEALLRLKMPNRLGVYTWIRQSKLVGFKLNPLHKFPNGKEHRNILWHFDIETSLDDSQLILDCLAHNIHVLEGERWYLNCVLAADQSNDTSLKTVIDLKQSAI
jgi:hypothetical protein